MHHLRCNLAGALAAILFVAIGFAALREADDAWDSWVFSLTIGLLLIAVLLAAHRTGDRRAFWIGCALFGWGYLSLSLMPSTGPRLIVTKALAYIYRSTTSSVRVSTVRFILDLDLMRTHNLSSDDLRVAPRASGMVSARSARYDDLMKVAEDNLVSPAQFDPATGRASQTVEYVPRWGERYRKPDQYENIIVKVSPDGEVLRIKDVARVEMGSPFYVPGWAGTAEDFIHIGHSLFALLAAWLGGVLSRRLRAVHTPSTSSPPGQATNPA